MFLSYQDDRDFRQYCNFESKFDFWSRFTSMELESLHDNDDEYNGALFQRIETDMVEWAKKNTNSKVYYSGDFDFEFESEDERDAFDKEFGDPLAFKLRFA